METDKIHSPTRAVLLLTRRRYVELFAALSQRIISFAAEKSLFI